MSGISAFGSASCGTFSSSTMIVMMTAITPSVKASSRPLVIPTREIKNVRINTAWIDSYGDQPDRGGRWTYRAHSRQGDFSEEHAREGLRDHNGSRLSDRLRDLPARRLRQTPRAGHHHAHRARGRVRGGIHQAVRAAVALYRDGQLLGDFPLPSDPRRHRDNDPIAPGSAPAAECRSTRLAGGDRGDGRGVPHRRGASSAALACQARKTGNVILSAANSFHLALRAWQYRSSTWPCRRPGPVCPTAPGRRLPRELSRRRYAAAEYFSSGRRLPPPKSFLRSTAATGLHWRPDRHR